MNRFVKYKPLEVLKIYQINQVTWSLVDEDVENSPLKPNTSICDWRKMNDLVDWSELYKIQNDQFNLTLSQKEWLDAVLPEKTKTIWQLCEFVSKHAEKEIINPVIILGKECLSASVFLTLKRDLSKRGLDVKDLSPNSPISRYTDFNKFPKLVAEVAKRGVSVSDEIELKYKEGLPFWQRLNFFSSKRFYIDTGTTKSFRDLTKRIMDATYTAGLNS